MKSNHISHFYSLPDAHPREALSCHNRGMRKLNVAAPAFQISPLPPFPAASGYSFVTSESLSISIASGPHPTAMADAPAGAFAKRPRIRFAGNTPGRRSLFVTCSVRICSCWANQYWLGRRTQSKSGARVYPAGNIRSLILLLRLGRYGRARPQRISPPSLASASVPQNFGSQATAILRRKPSCRSWTRSWAVTPIESS